MRISAIAVAAALSTCASTAFGGALPRLPPMLRGVPAADRQDVPTDVIPALEAAALGIGLERTLNDFQFTLRSSSGEDIPISVSLPQRAGYLSIQPAQVLEPYTTYVLETVIRPPLWQDDPGSLSLSFTTGAGRLDSVPSPISGVVQHWWSPEGGSEDFPGEGLCVGFPNGADDELVEIRYVKPESGNPNAALPDDFYVDATLEAGPFLTAAGDGGRSASNYHDLCVQFRRRAIDGRFSAPTTTCSSYAPIYVIDAYDAQAKCGSGFVDTETLSALPGPPESTLPSTGGEAPLWPSDGDSSVVISTSAPPAPSTSPADRADSAGCGIARRQSAPSLPLVLFALGACVAARRGRATAPRAAGRAP